MIGVTLDSGALIALERKDRRMLAVLARATATDAQITVPASVIAQVMRDPVRQVVLSRLLRQPHVRLPTLDGRIAIQVGRLLAASRTSDVVDAHVVLCAMEADDAIVTSDPEDLMKLNPQVRLVVV